MDKARTSSLLVDIRSFFFEQYATQWNCTSSENFVKGELHGKMIITCKLEFGLVSDVVKVFPVGSISLARKSTRKK